MQWNKEPRRDTEWTSWFAWHAVPLETTYTGDRQHMDDAEKSMVRWEKIERRRMAMSNNQWCYIYRLVGSKWDFKMTKPPGPND